MRETYEIELLPSLMEMRATFTGPPIGLWAFANFRGSLEIAYAFSSIFWPEFVEDHGGVFLAEQFKESSFQHWSERLDGDLTRIEAVMNQAHIGDFFLNAPSDDALDVRVSQQFGRALAGCWRAALAEAFPD